MFCIHPLLSAKLSTNRRISGRRRASCHPGRLTKAGTYDASQNVRLESSKRSHQNPDILSFPHDLDHPRHWRMGHLLRPPIRDLRTRCFQHCDLASHDHASLYARLHYSLQYCNFDTHQAPLTVDCRDWRRDRSDYMLHFAYYG